MIALEGVTWMMLSMTYRFHLLHIVERSEARFPEGIQCVVCNFEEDLVGLAIFYVVGDDYYISGC